jgi:hypothetical protein
MCLNFPPIHNHNFYFFKTSTNHVGGVLQMLMVSAPCHTDTNSTVAKITVPISAYKGDSVSVRAGLSQTLHTEKGKTPTWVGSDV